MNLKTGNMTRAVQRNKTIHDFIQPFRGVDISSQYSLKRRGVKGQYTLNSYSIKCMTIAKLVRVQLVGPYTRMMRIKQHYNV